MIGRVDLEVNDERHKNCVICLGDKTSKKIFKCAIETCSKIIHLGCDEHLELHQSMGAWCCSPECEALRPSPKISQGNSEVPDITIQPQMDPLQKIESQKRTLSRLTAALKDAMASSDRYKSELESLQQKFDNVCAENEGLQSRLVQALDSHSGADDEAEKLLKTFNETFVPHASPTPIHSNINASRDVTSRDKVDTFKIASSYSTSAAGTSHATLMSRERVRARLQKVNSSQGDLLHRDERELTRLKLARQQLDELNKFNGNNMEWLAFEEEVYTVWDAGEYSNYEMIKKLRKALEGDARDYVKLALSLPEANPEHVIETLRRKYYHPNEAVSKALRSIMTIDAIRNKVRRPLEKFLTAVENYIQTCRLVKIEGHLQARVSADVEAKLPYDLRAEWHKLVRMGQDENGTIVCGNWTDFNNFLREIIQDMPLAMDFAKNAKTDHKCNHVTINSPRKDSKGKFTQKCLYDNCEGGALYRCTEFRKLPHHERLNFIDKNKICKRCINSTRHAADKCPLAHLKCLAEDCDERDAHATILHPNANTINHVNSDTKDFTFFQMVPILLFDYKDMPVRTLALLDSGSDTTIMSQDLFNKLSLPSEPYRLDINWCAAGIFSVDKASQIFNCEIAPVDNPSMRYSIKDVVTMNKLRLPHQSQNAAQLKGLFPFLKDVPLPSYSNQRPQMIIGIRQRHLMVASEIVRLDDLPIVAEHTALGWTISGSTKQQRGKRTVATCYAKAGFIPGDDKRNESTKSSGLTADRGPC